MSDVPNLGNLRTVDWTRSSPSRYSPPGFRVRTSPLPLEWSLAVRRRSAATHTGSLGRGDGVSSGRRGSPTAVTTTAASHGGPGVLLPTPRASDGTKGAPAHEAPRATSCWPRRSFACYSHRRKTPSPCRRRPPRGWLRNGWAHCRRATRFRAGAERGVTGRVSNSELFPTPTRMQIANWKLRR